MAAKTGDLEAVKQLVEAVKGDNSILCAPCAAATAAKHQHTNVVRWLVEGAAKEMMRVSWQATTVSSLVQRLSAHTK